MRSFEGRGTLSRHQLKGAREDQRLESLLNIGPAMAAKLRAVGVRTRSDFLRRDPYALFHRLRGSVEPTLCRCALSALVGAKLNQKWWLIHKESSLEYLRRYRSASFRSRC